MIALFKFVGSKQIPNLWFLDLSLDSTSMKLLIQRVASVTGFNTLGCSILSISFLNVSFRCMGTGLQGVCFGWMLGSRSWYKEDPESCQFPQRHLGNF